jgi:hypothetical protein
MPKVSRQSAANVADMGAAEDRGEERWLRRHFRDYPAGRGPGADA